MTEEITGTIPSLAAATSMGAVRLIVHDKQRQVSFYSDAIGLELAEESSELSRLVSGDRVLVELEHRQDASARPRGTTGLYHLAILLPDRPALASAIERVLSAGWSFTGAADHLVSEAFYLNDPEGNGIELYRDRPREEWQFVHGELKMASLPIDVDEVMAELPEGGITSRVNDARMGHVHLQVRDIDEAETFYHGVLGFDVVVRGYPGALFVSAGGYHHHLGLNTWGGRGAPSAPKGAQGLARFEIVLPDEDELTRVSARIAEADVMFQIEPDGIVLDDPSRNQMVIRVPKDQRIRG